MAKIDLVFRQVDERTRDVALKLAIEHIRPDNTHVIDDVRPFHLCVDQMLRIDHDSDYVVYVDADCLILEDLRGFIEQTDAPYVDCYVSDRFRGRVHCGVHITRIDVVRRMREIERPSNDMRYVLRPESRVRNLAMQSLRESKQFRNFDILHDYFQYYRHVFTKYALREVRSRNKMQRHRLEHAMHHWPGGNGGLSDHVIARHAVEYARANLDADAPAPEVHAFIERLPAIAQAQLESLGVSEKAPFGEDDLRAWLAENQNRETYGGGQSKPKIFGIGFGRTGTRSLTRALQILGYDVAHYPRDEDSFVELSNAQYDLTILKYHDGLTDITTVPFYQQLDQNYPGSKFVLTVRDQESWLRSYANHYYNRPYDKVANNAEEELELQMRPFLRAAVFGCYNFAPERFTWVYERHLADVQAYFKDRSDDLLIMNIVDGDGFEKLAPFVGRKLPTEPFPHSGAVLSRRMRPHGRLPERGANIW